MEITTNARIYGRFSSIPQEKGDSRRRQIEGAKTYALKNGLQIIGEPYFDEGVSGKAGLNLEKEFGRLLNEAKSGESILVEALDRVGRQNPFILGNLIYQTIQRGISVHAWQEGKIITPDNIDEIGTQFSIFTQAAVGHQDNRRKMIRLNESFNKSLDDARKGIPSRNLTKCLPQAIIWDDTAKKFKTVPDIQQTIKRIYREYAAGKGTTSIARGLNTDKVPTLYQHNQQTIGKLKPWLETSIKKVLNNKSYNGVLVIKGEQFTGLIPKIISDDLFNKVQMLLGRYSSRHGKYDSLGRTNNLFPTVAYCSDCGGTVNVNKIQKKGEKPLYFYRCKNARLRVCKNKHTMLHAGYVEHGFFDTFFGNSASSLIRDDNANIQIKEQIEALKTKLNTIDTAIGNLYDLVEAGDKEAIKRIEKRRADKIEVENQIKILGAKLVEDSQFDTQLATVKDMLTGIKALLAATTDVEWNNAHDDSQIDWEALANEGTLTDLGLPTELDKYVASLGSFETMERILNNQENRKKLSVLLPSLFGKVVFDCPNGLVEAFDKNGKSIGVYSTVHYKKKLNERRAKRIKDTKSKNKPIAKRLKSK